MANENGTARLDRIERALELLIADHVPFREEHKRLLVAQVVLTERVDKLGERMDQLTQRMDQLTQHVGGIDQRLDRLSITVEKMGERLDGLIGVVESIIPRLPQA